MLKDDSLRLRHILEAVRKALSFLGDKSRPELDQDEVLALALVRLLEVVGEAASMVSMGFRDRHPQVP